MIFPLIRTARHIENAPKEVAKFAKQCMPSCCICLLIHNPASHCKQEARAYNFNYAGPKSVNTCLGYAVVREPDCTRIALEQYCEVLGLLPSGLHQGTSAKNLRMHWLLQPQAQITRLKHETALRPEFSEQSYILGSYVAKRTNPHPQTRAFADPQMRAS